jgi:SAM-dependent methyltransferase
MNPTMSDNRQPLPSILTVYRTVEEFWESSGHVGGLRDDSVQVINPLDAFLIHRIFDLMPGEPVVIDAAMEKTRGASSVIALVHPRVRGIWVAADRGSADSIRAVSALRSYMKRRGSVSASLEVFAWSELQTKLTDRRNALILTDARRKDPASAAQEINRWLDERPDAVVLVLGLGSVGDCPTIASLLRFCDPRSGNQVRLMREVSEVLMGSRMGLVARRDHPGVAGMLRRLGQSHAGNYRYLDLLRQVHQAALREANVDAEVMKNHPTFWPLLKELDDLRRAQGSLSAELRVPKTDGHGGTGSHGLLLKVRRKLAPTPVGSAWRLAKQTRKKLARTPLGTAYRKSKRFGGSCVEWGRKLTSAVNGAMRSAQIASSRSRQNVVSGTSDNAALHVHTYAGGGAAGAGQAGRSLIHGMPRRTLTHCEGDLTGEIEEASLCLSPSRLKQLLPLLTCPHCRGALLTHGHALVCDACHSRFPLHSGRPVLNTTHGSPTAPFVHHPISSTPTEILDWMTWFDGWILLIGAGETRIKLEHVVEVGTWSFPHTDIVANFHRLPFGDASFDAVVSLYTLEQAETPELAISEIFRVLKPGGRLVVRTSCLPRLHDTPHHYYSVSERGLAHWFREFDITAVSVCEDFNLGHVIGKLAADILDAVERIHGSDARNRVADSSLDFWRSGLQEAARREHPLWDVLRGLSQDDRLRYTADLQLAARKPIDEESTAA